MSDEARGDWINLLGVRVSALDMPRAVARIRSAVETRARAYVCVTGVHGVIECQRDATLRAVHNAAYLVTPDGMPLVWALKLAGHRRSDRVYGPDLMLAVFEAGRAQGLRHFLYGSSQATLDRLRSRLLERFPGAEIVGTLSPPFRALEEREEDEIALAINATGADIVWVGLSTPKQELWMARMRDRLTPPVLIGVGAAFDFHAGVKRQAPRFVQRSGFEWLYRLASEPRRLGARYAVAVPSFLWLAAVQATGLRRFPLDR